MPAFTGTGGNVAGSGLYVTNVYQWEINLTSDALETTAVGATSRTFVAGLKNHTGSFNCRVDNTTTIVDTGITASATFTLESGYTITCSIVLTGATISLAVDQVVEVTYTFQVSGAVSITNT